MPHGTRLLGGFEITALCDLSPHFPSPFSKAFPTIPPERHDEIRARYPAAFDGPDVWVFHDHCYLLRTPTASVLFDTGMGGAWTLGSQWIGVTGGLPEELAAADVVPGGIDVVVISHAHLDHIGWTLDTDGAPLFPNARYALQRAEWEGFPAAGDSDDETAFDQSLRPLEALGVLDLVNGEERLAEGLTLHLAAGHTPGHQVAVLESRGERAVLSGDLANHPGQTAEPSWRTGADMDPDSAAATRARWFDTIEEWDALLCTAHFPEPFGHLRREGGVRIWSPLPSPG
jgi:glyoxylase-like metal-dependent hydrolase (beta-lactamase superfamily II)